METHREYPHTRLHGWKRYVYEFLMFFLAISASFFVENFRERKVEQHRAEDFAISMISDLKADTSLLHGLIKIRTWRMQELDTILTELQKPAELQNDTLLFASAFDVLSRRSYFSTSSGTYEQIQNSGSMRYFDIPIASSMVEYARGNRVHNIQLEIENKYVLENAVNLRTEFCNKEDVYVVVSTFGLLNGDTLPAFTSSQPLLNKSAEVESKVFTTCIFLMERNRIYLASLDNLLEIANDLLTKLETEYGKGE